MVVVSLEELEELPLPEPPPPPSEGSLSFEFPLPPVPKGFPPPHVEQEIC
jgi:hypothetical protein